MARECSLQALEDRAQRLEKQVQEMARDLDNTRFKQQVRGGEGLGGICAKLEGVQYQMLKV